MTPYLTDAELLIWHARARQEALKIARATRRRPRRPKLTHDEMLDACAVEELRQAIPKTGHEFGLPPIVSYGPHETEHPNGSMGR